MPGSEAGARAASGAETKKVRGREALEALVGALGSRLDAAGGWLATVRCVSADGQTKDMQVGSGAAGASEVCAWGERALDAGGEVSLWTPQIPSASARASDPDRRSILAGFGLEVALDALFQIGGPLEFEAPGGPTGEPALVPSHRQVAAEFMVGHLADSLFPPTCVIDLGWTFVLVYVLDRPATWTRTTGAALERIANVVAGTTFAARRLWEPFLLPLGDLLDERPSAGARACLLQNPHWRLLRADRVEERVTRLHAALDRADPPVSGGRSPRAPAAMGLRTLAPGWTLADLSLAPAIRRGLAAGTAPRGHMWEPSSLQFLVRRLAEHGHGWLDVETLFAVPRLRLASAIEVGQVTWSTLKHAFREGLAQRDLRHRVRLPFGVRRIEFLRRGDPGEVQRVRLCGRCDDRAFQLEMDEPSLRSGPSVARAVGLATQHAFSPLPPRTWATVLDQALADPRVSVSVRATATPAPLLLTDRLRQFLAKAAPHDADVRLSSRSPTGWPVLRGDIVVFARPALEHVLRAQGVSFRRAELTRAIESLGGGPRGVLHYPGSGKIRSWACPVPMALGRAQGASDQGRRSQAR